MLKNQLQRIIGVVNILNEKSIRYYKTYEHFLDPGFLLNDESFAKDLLNKENKEM